MVNETMFVFRYLQLWISIQSSVSITTERVLFRFIVDGDNDNGRGKYKNATYHLFNSVNVDISKLSQVQEKVQWLELRAFAVTLNLKIEIEKASALHPSQRDKEKKFSTVPEIDFDIFKMSSSRYSVGWRSRQVKAKRASETIKSFEL
jgi:hypothetical protein